MSTKIKFLIALTLTIIAAATLYILSGTQSISLSQRVNAGLDDLEALGSRILQLPTVFLFSAGLFLAAVAVLATQRLGFGRIRWLRAAMAIAIIVCSGGLAVHADRRIQTLQDRLSTMKEQLAQSRLDSSDMQPRASLAPAQPTVPTLAADIAHNPPAPIVGTLRDSKPPTPSSDLSTQHSARTTPFFDRTAVQSALAPTFGRSDIAARITDSATDVIQVKLPAGPAVAFLSIIDLTLPGVQIKLGTNTARKTLTSDFARSNNCTIAINGEAGLSPAANSGLGTWTGHLVSQGQVILTEFPNNPRPFLAFTASNLPTYNSQWSTNRAVPADSYNVIWGRMDALLNGIVQSDPERNRQPRTAMGVNADGTRLYLMIVDGRQRGYSIGLTRAETGAFLKAFGANNAMLCDEGGSSCLYAQNGGILNYPSDGEERPTYTHFGIVTPK